MSQSVPHPIPYQGSKRRLASTILSTFPHDVHTLYEPFAGSGAVTLAALKSKRVRTAHLGDSLSELVDLWTAIMGEPKALMDGYRDLWHQQAEDPRSFYDHVRSTFNEEGGAHRLLYLLARCVKNAVRFNRHGHFNQSADHRRMGTRPETMARRIMGAHELLRGRAQVTHGDYRSLVAQSTQMDLVYMDPPYEGTSGSRDLRYYEQFRRAEFIECLEGLIERDVPFIVSLDGRTGNKSYGTHLPSGLGLERREVDAGPSTQATLNGRRARTVESLYLSPALQRLTGQ